MSTSGHNHEYIRGCSVHRRDTMSTSGGYNKYIGRCWVHRGISWCMWGSTLIQFLLKTPMYWTSPNVLNVPQCTGHPPMYSWYPSHASWYPHDILSISHVYHEDHPPCIEHPPMYSWYLPRCTNDIPPDVLNTHYTGWKSAKGVFLPQKSANCVIFRLSRSIEASKFCRITIFVDEITDFMNFFQ